MVDQDKSTIISVVLFSLAGFLSCFFFTGGMGIAYASVIFCSIVALFLSWNKDIKIPLHTLIILGFAVYAGLSFFWSTSPYITLVSWLILLIFPISYLLGRNIYSNNNIKNTSLYLLIGFVVVSSLYGIADLLLHDRDRLTALFANPNTFSALLVLCFIPCAVFLLQNKNQKILWLGLSLFFFIIILLTGSRSGLLTAVTALTIIFVLSQGRGKLKYASILLLASFVIVTIFYFNDAPFLTRFFETFSEKYHASTQGRLIIWEGSWALALDHLLLGTGLGTFFLNYPIYRLSGDPSVGDWAHLDSLQILSEIGVIGFLFWIAFWTGLLYSCFKNRKHLSSYTLIGLTGCLSLFFQGHLTYIYLTLPLLFMLGLYLALYDTECSSQGVIITKKWNIMPFTIILVLTAQSAFSMFLTRQAQQDMYRANTVEAEQKINLIETVGSPYFYEHLMVLGKRGDLTALKTVKERCPSCSSPYFVAGLIHLQQRNVSMAKQEIWNAMTKDPSDQNIRLHFVRILEQQGRIKEASMIAQQGFAYPIDDAQELYFKEIILMSQKNQ